MSAFDDDKFREIYPISFVMRKAISDFWFRIHSLPESKRYAEDETEWEILFERHRALTNEVLVEGGLCRVHYTLFCDGGFSEDLAPSLDWGDIRPQSYGDEQTLTPRRQRRFGVLMPSSHGSDAGQMTTWAGFRFIPWIPMRFTRPMMEVPTYSHSIPPLLPRSGPDSQHGSRLTYREHEEANPKDRFER